MPVPNPSHYGARLLEPNHAKLLQDLQSTQNAITAFAGGGQTGGVLLTNAFSRVTTVGTAADSVKLPGAKAGMKMVVVNAAAANSMNVFPSSGDAINAAAADAAFAMAANKSAYFVCVVDGIWNAILTA